LTSIAESSSTALSSGFLVCSSGTTSSVGSGGGFSFRLIVDVEKSWDNGRIAEDCRCARGGCGIRVDNEGDNLW
jgi:hypothetical protein